MIHLFINVIWRWPIFCRQLLFSHTHSEVRWALYNIHQWPQHNSTIREALTLSLAAVVCCEESFWEIQSKGNLETCTEKPNCFPLTSQSQACCLSRSLHMLCSTVLATASSLSSFLSVFSSLTLCIQRIYIEIHLSKTQS